MDHNCASCGLKIPECGHSKRVGEGYCNTWVQKSVSSKQTIGEN